MWLTVAISGFYHGQSRCPASARRAAHRPLILTQQSPPQTLACPAPRANCIPSRHPSFISHSTLWPVQVMRRVLSFLQLLFSAARRALLPSRAVLPLIRIIVALKRFVRGCFKSFGSPGVSTSTRVPEPRSTTPQQLIQSVQAPGHYMPSVVPTGLGPQQDAPLPQHSAVPDTTLRNLPKPFAPERFQRYQHRRPVYVISAMLNIDHSS